MDNLNTAKLQNGLRCEKCNKLLAVHNGDKTYEIKCARCGALNIILDEMKEQVIVTNPEGEILFVNSVVPELTGYSFEEVIGRNPSLWGGQMPREFYEKMWHTISKEKKGVEVVVRNRHKSGRFYNALLRISPVLDTKGEVAFYIGFESLIANEDPRNKGSM